MGKKRRPAKGPIRKLQPEWVSRVDVETAEFVNSLLEQQPVSRPPPFHPQDGSTTRMRPDTHDAVATVALM